MNKLSTNVLEGEATSLMKTIDTLISENLKKKEEKKQINLNQFSETKNCLLEEFGNTIIHLLEDLFVSSNGPKLRDLFSHGVIQPDCIHPSILDQILVLFSFLCIKYIPISKIGTITFYFNSFHFFTFFFNT